jgi:hypothetical protein
MGVIELAGALQLDGLRERGRANAEATEPKERNCKPSLSLLLQGFYMWYWPVPHAVSKVRVWGASHSMLGVL